MNCNNNSQNLLSTTLFSCPRLLGYEVKHGNVGPTFSSFNAVLLKSIKNIQWFVLLDASFSLTLLEHCFVWVKALSFSTELAQNNNILMT